MREKKEKKKEKRRCDVCSLKRKFSLKSKRTMGVFHGSDRKKKDVIGSHVIM